MFSQHTQPGSASRQYIPWSLSHSVHVTMVTVYTLPWSQCTRCTKLHDHKEPITKKTTIKIHWGQPKHTMYDAKSHTLESAAPSVYHL